MNKTYMVTMRVKATEAQADALTTELAQIVYDEFQLGSAYDLSVSLEITAGGRNDRVVAGPSPG